MAKYFRLILGRGSKFASQCRNEGIIGVDYGMDMDFSGKFHENWRDFNKEYIPLYLSKHPDKTKIAAGLACGTIWSVFNTYGINDIVISPNGAGKYMVGIIEGEYKYVAGHNLPHQRKVSWLDQEIARADMSDELKHSTGSIGAYCDITSYQDEIDRLAGGTNKPPITVNDPTIEDSSEFALEKHLEEFMVRNWGRTALGKKFDIFEMDGDKVGNQYPTDTGAIDILAISKDKKTILVIELKKGRASDSVLGQIQRYMGYVKDELADRNQMVLGAIIGFEKDTALQRALSVAPSISFYKYQIKFTLEKQ